MRRPIRYPKNIKPVDGVDVINPAMNKAIPT